MEELNFDHDKKIRSRIGGNGSQKNPAYARARYQKDVDSGLMYALGAVKRAIKRGELLCLKKNKIKCVLCRYRATEYDHRDYNKPLEVSPVCTSCNQVMGAAIPVYKHYGKIR